MTISDFKLATLAKTFGVLAEFGMKLLSAIRTRRLIGEFSWA